MHRAGIKNKVADALLRLGTVGTDITKLYGDFPELLLAFIEHRGGNINDARDGDSDFYIMVNSVNELLKR